MLKDSITPLMTKEQFKAELKYRAAIDVAKSMLDKGLIGEEEYTKFDTIFLQKFSPFLSTLLAGKSP